MKANKAPKKIYLTKNLSGELMDGWDELPSEIFPNIEYTRTDAFIEKTEKYLQEHLIDYWSQVVTDESNFIEDFKNYMKGE